MEPQTDEGTNRQAVRMVIAISWLVYAIPAYFIFAFSAFTFSVSRSAGEIITSLLVSCLPFFAMVGVSFLSIKKQSWKIAILAVPSAITALVLAGIIFKLYLDFKIRNTGCKNGTVLVGRSDRGHPICKHPEEARQDQRR